MIFKSDLRAAHLDGAAEKQLMKILRLGRVSDRVLAKHAVADSGRSGSEQVTIGCLGPERGQRALQHRREHSSVPAADWQFDGYLVRFTGRQRHVHLG